MALSDTEMGAVDRAARRASEATAERVERKKRLTMSTIVAIVSILGTVAAGGRWILTPWFVAVATDSLGGEMSKRAETQAAPANGGVKALLVANIKQLESEARFENLRKARTPLLKWTDLDEMKLSNLESRLADARASLAEFEQAAAKAKAEAR